MSIRWETAESTADWSASRLGGRNVASLTSDVLPVADFMCLLLAAMVSAWIYGYLLLTGDPASGQDTGFTRVALFVAALGPFILYDRLFGAFASHGDRRDLVRSFALRFALLTVVVLALGSLSAALENLPHSLLLLWFAVSLMLTAITRMFAAGYLQRLRHRGTLTEAIAVVGAGPAADRLVTALRQMQPEAVELLGVFDDQSSPSGSGFAAPTGNLAQLLELGRSRRIDWVLLTQPPSADQDTQSLVQQLQILSVPIAHCPSLMGTSVTWPPLDFVGEALPVRLLADRPIRRWDAVIKSAEDLVGGTLILLLLLPLLAGIALAIRLGGPGPIIFKQRRHTLDNREFDIYKFRTMHWVAASGTDDLQQTTRLDARVTPLGRFLRASSLDELPQLLNVLRGEMSLVGPRPHAVNMRTVGKLGSEITDLYAHRHRVKPGLTGWSQVNGARGATESEAQLRRRVELDLYYIENWSVALDIKILALTVREVLKRTNAY